MVLAAKEIVMVLFHSANAARSLGDDDDDVRNLSLLQSAGQGFGAVHFKTNERSSGLMRSRVQPAAMPNAPGAIRWKVVSPSWSSPECA